MPPEYVEDEAFERNKRQIARNVENTLERVVDDYGRHWRGVVSESLQNSFDAWCTNRFEREILPADRDLVVDVAVDTDERVYRVRDNAGGMPEEAFYERFAGLDTPGEAKREGGAGGSYGRGFHVVAGLGERTYAETRHDGFAGGLVVRGADQMRLDAQRGLDDRGTLLEVSDCDAGTLANLADVDRVRRYVRERFQPMLDRDDVTVRYAVDGETTELEPADLDGFELLWEGELDFEFRGDEYALRDVRIYDATSADRDVPFRGVEMLKRNEHLEEPFLRVHEYTPRHLKHVDELFGFCDASELCPDYEGNAHNRFTDGVSSETGLRGLLEGLEREHFIGTPTDLDERDEIVGTALSVINRQWRGNPFEGDRGDEDGAGEETAGETPDAEPAAGEDAEAAADAAREAIDRPPATPTVSASARETALDVGETVRIWATVENPADSDRAEFDLVTGLEGPSELDPDDRHVAVEPGEGTEGAHSWSIAPEREGVYEFAVYLHAAGGDREALGGDRIRLRVGDVEDEGPAVTPASFVESVTFVREEDDDAFRAELTVAEEGFELVANTAHPEWKRAVRIDGSSEVDEQRLTLVRWADKAILDRMLLDEIEARLAGYETADGTPLSDELGEFVRERYIDRHSDLVASAHEQVR